MDRNVLSLLCAFGAALVTAIVVRSLLRQAFRRRGRSGRRRPVGMAFFAEFCAGYALAATAFIGTRAAVLALHPLSAAVEAVRSKVAGSLVAGLATAALLTIVIRLDDIERARKEREPADAGDAS